MSGTEIVKNVKLSTQWSDASDKLHSKMLWSTRSVFRMLTEERVGLKGAMQELRNILRTQAEYIDTQATTNASRKAKRKGMSVFHLLEQGNQYQSEPDFSLIPDLLEVGFSIDQKDAEGYTALMRAVKHNNPKAVEAFAAYGADVNIPLLQEFGGIDYPLLQHALDKKKYAIASILLRHGADFNTPYVRETGTTATYSVATNFTSPWNCKSSVLHDLIWNGLDPIYEFGQEPGDNIAAMLIADRDSIKGKKEHKHAVLGVLLDAGIPLSLAEENIQEEKFDGDRFAEIITQTKKNSEKLWKAFQVNPDYEVLDVTTLMRFSNIGKLDALIKDPSLWRTKERATKGLRLLDILPPYLQENYTHERLLMEEKAQSKQTGWVR